MTPFLAGRDKLRSKRLHKRISNRLLSDGRLENCKRAIAGPRDPGPYRVVGDTTRGRFVDASADDDVDAAIEIGFRLATDDPYEHYWINWIEPDDGFLMGWHQDDTHGDLGPVHFQLHVPDGGVTREPATFIDKHPMAVTAARFEQLPSALEDHVET